MSLKRAASLITLVVFVMTTLMPVSYAQVLVPMSGVSQMVGASSAFDPALMAGVKVDPRHPLNMEFFISKGQEKLSADVQKDEYSRLLKYFLSALTVPQGNLWVNLSPVEKDRIIPDDLAKTRMGMDLLSQDYFLKQLTASLLYPEGKTGKEFWAKVYAKAYETYGTSEIPVDTFNKVWIVPEKLIVYEDHGTAWVTYAHLKVMLETDYLAQNAGEVLEPPLRHATGDTGALDVGAVQEPPLRKDIAKQTLRDIIIPILEKEVNEGQNFAVLRQIVHAMALAEWYKRSLKETILGKGYADRSKMAGIDSEAATKKWGIYDKYVQAFKAGVFNYIKEEVDPVTQETIPRKYVSGGFGANLDAAETVVTDMAALTSADRSLVEKSLASRQAFKLDKVVSRFDSPNGKVIDLAMTAGATESVFLPSAGQKKSGLAVPENVQSMSADGKVMAAYDGTGVVIYERDEDGVPVPFPPIPWSTQVYPVVLKVFPDGKRVLGFQEGRDADVWVRKGSGWVEEAHLYVEFSASMTGTAAISADGSHFVLESHYDLPDSETINIKPFTLDPQQGAWTHPDALRLIGKSVDQLVLSPDGKMILAREKTSGLFTAWEQDQSGRWSVSDWLGSLNRSSALAFSPDGRRFVAGFPDGRIYLRDRDEQGSWGPALSLRAMSGPVTHAAFSRDGKKLLVGTADRIRFFSGEAQKWQVAEGSDLDIAGSSAMFLSDDQHVFVERGEKTSAGWRSISSLWRVAVLPESKPQSAVDAEIAWRQELDVWLKKLEEVEDQQKALEAPAATAAGISSEGRRAELSELHKNLNNLAAVITALGNLESGVTLTGPQRQALEEQKATLKQIVGLQEKILAFGIEAAAPVQGQSAGGFEYLPQDQIRELASMTDPSGQKTNSVTMLPDGRILTGVEDGTAKIWKEISPGDWTIDAELSDFIVGATFGKGSAVKSAVMLPDRYIWTARANGRVRTWVEKSGKWETANVISDAGAVNSIVPLPDGRVLTANDDKTAILWKEVEPGSNLWDVDATLAGHTGTVTSAVPLPDGRILTASREGTAKIWKKWPLLNKWRVVATLGYPWGNVFPLFSAMPMADGRIVTAAGNECAVIWKETSPGSDDWTTEGVLIGPPGPMLSAVPIPGGGILTTSQNGMAQIWKETSPGEWKPLLTVPGALHAEMQPDGRLVTADDKGTVKIWQVAKAVPGEAAPGKTKELKELDVLPLGVNQAEMLPDGRLLIRRGKDMVSILKSTSSKGWKVETSLPDKKLEFASASMLPDGRILTMNDSGPAKIWKKNFIGKWKPVAALAGHVGQLYFAKALSDGRILEWGGAHDAVLWKENAETGMWLPDGVIPCSNFELRSARMLADGRVLTMNSDGTVRIWRDFLTGKWQDVAVFRHNPAVVNGVTSMGGVNSAEMLPDGRILTANEDNSANLWKETVPGSNQWDEVATLAGHTGRVVSAQGMADGRILTVSQDGTAKIWEEVGSGVWDAKITINSDSQIRYAEELPDGRVLTVDKEGVIRFWQVPEAGAVPFSVAAPLQKNIVALNRQKLTDQQQALRLRLAELEEVYQAPVSFDRGRKDSAQAAASVAKIEFLPPAQFQKVDTVENVLNVSADGKLRVITYSNGEVVFQEKKTDGSFRDIRRFVTFSRNPMAFSLDGRRFAINMSNEFVDIYVKNDEGKWISEESLYLKDFQGIKDILFSPDGTRIAVADSKENAPTVEIYRLDPVTGRWVLESALTQVDGKTVSMSFSRDGKRFLLGNNVNDDTVWDRQSHGQWTMSANIRSPGSVQKNAFSPDGKAIFFGFFNRINIVNEKTLGEWVSGSRIELEKEVKGVNFSPDGKTMAILLANSVVWAEKKKGKWRVVKGAEISLGDSVPSGVTFMSDGQNVAISYLQKTGNKDETRSDMQVWRVFGNSVAAEVERDALEAELARLEARHVWLEKLVEVEAQLEALKGNEEARAELLARQEALNKMVAVIDTLGSPEAGATLTQAQRRALNEQKVTLEQVVGVQEKMAEPESAAPVQAQPAAKLEYLPLDKLGLFPGMEDPSGQKINSVTMLYDGRILTGVEDGTAKIWEETSPGKWEVKEVLDQEAGAVKSVVMFMKEYILTARENGVLTVWFSRSGHWYQLSHLFGHTGSVNSAVEFGDWGVLSASDDGTARVWKQPFAGSLDWEIRATLAGHTGPVMSAVPMPGGRILTASRDGTAKIWQETSSGQWAVVATLDHQGGIHLAFFSAVPMPDGRILTGSGSRMAEIWEESSPGSNVWEVKAELQDYTGWVISAVPLPDGHILTTNNDGTAQIWEETSPGNWGAIRTIPNALHAEMQPDGRLVTADDNGTVRIWQVAKAVTGSSPVGTPPQKNIVGLNRQKLTAEQRLLLEKLTKLEEVYKPQIQWDAAKKRSDAAQGQGLADKLERSVSGAVAPGGIDLNVKNFNFEMRANGPKLSEGIAGAGGIDMESVTGLVPVIISVVPAQWPAALSRLAGSQEEQGV